MVVADSCCYAEGMSQAPPPRNSNEQKLEALERDVIKGQAALAARNALVVQMSNKGYSQADLTRRLNRQRQASGARLLTPDALHMIIKRSTDRKRK